MFEKAEGRRQKAENAWRSFLLPSAFCLLLSTTAGAAATQKVIVIGFDGADAKYTEQWMNEGKLPNMAKLRAAGTFRPLRPTVPAQTPVSWSTFSTG
ncbi:MAG: alkaline phosphatase family protein, partial [Thermoanaerobaculia bacterium]